MLERDYSEKRNFIRMTVNSPAKISIEQDGTTIYGICHDLSGSGMLLTVNQALPTESELLITLTPEKHIGPSLRARCTIARTQAAAEGKYLIGVAIGEILDHHSTEAVA